MASTGETETTGSAVTESATAEEPSPADLRRQLAVLEAENRQLREEYARAQQATYRRTALGLFIVGVAGIVGGLIFPDTQTVLFALGGTGIFAGVLTSVLTPERFVSARVGTQLLQALRADRDATVDELGLQGDPVYVPAGEVRLFIPRHRNQSLPAESALGDLFVVPETPDQGGVAFHPTGQPLFEAFEDTRTQPLGERPSTIAETAADALVELFELADGVDYEVDTDTGRVTFEVVGAGLGDPTGIDHPIPSFLAVSMVETLGVPVRVDITDDDPLAITCRYELHDES